MPSNSARGDAFERYTLALLRRIYPQFAWYHQGRDKGRERGLDFVGNRIGDSRGEHSTIGVQVKFHAPNNAPTEKEWLKFLAGCFARRLPMAVFITTGKLTGEQRREAQAANVVVVEDEKRLYDWLSFMTSSLSNSLTKAKRQALRLTKHTHLLHWH